MSIGAADSTRGEDPEAVLALAGDTELGHGATMFKGIWMSLFDGYTSDSGDPFLDALLSKGGMSSMLNTVWLIICALGFGGVLERTGILNYLLHLALRGVKGSGSLITTTGSRMLTGLSISASSRAEL